jgi:hypothetical protein
MKERIIDIPKRAMRAPSRFDLARVGATMLFPDNEKDRVAYEESVAALLVCETQQLPELVQRSVREITDAARARFTHGGLFAGYTLHEALGRPRLGLCESGKGEIEGGLISDLKFDPKKRFARFSSKTLAKTWPLFRPVAHFWAATFVAMRRDREPFPCELSSFKDYLAMVEAFRIAGETTKAKQSPEPSLLRPAETVKLPANLKIRPADLEFLPMPAKKTSPD